MTPARRRLTNIFISIFAPLVIAIGFVFLNEELRPSGSRGGLPVWGSAVITLVGFVFLWREFRVYAFAMALVYLPAIFLLVNYTAYIVVMMFYGSRYL